MGCRHDYVGSTAGVPQKATDLLQCESRQSRPKADICASLHRAPLHSNTAASLFRRSNLASNPAPLRAYTRPRAVKPTKSTGAPSQVAHFFFKDTPTTDCYTTKRPEMAYTRQDVKENPG